MTSFRAQIGFPVNSSLPRDVQTINPTYNGTDAQALANALKANLIAQFNINTKPFTIKIYDAAKAPPSYPLATASQAGTPIVADYPLEVSLCLSFYAVYNRPRYRGRIYLPAWMVGQTMKLRPQQAQIDMAGSFAATFGKNLPTGTFWTVFSEVEKRDAQVDHWWVDDEWDTVRSRGLKATTRTVGTVP